MILDHAILGLLNIRARTGYDLKKAFDVSIRHFWPADQSHIYRVLGRLADKGYVTFKSVPQEGKPNRKVYTITQAGRKELETWLASRDRDESSKRSPYLVRLFFSSLLPDDLILTAMRNDLSVSRSYLNEYREISTMSLEIAQRKPSRERFFHYLTVDYGLWMRAAFIEWLERTLGLVEGGVADLADWPERFKANQVVDEDES